MIIFCDKITNIGKQKPLILFCDARKSCRGKKYGDVSQRVAFFIQTYITLTLFSVNILNVHMINFCHLSNT